MFGIFRSHHHSHSAHHHGRGHGPHGHGFRGRRHGGREAGPVPPQPGATMCPICDKHCPLSDPGCGKGAALAADRESH